MKRNAFFITLLLIVVVLGTLVYFAVQKGSASLLTGKKPNIIFILTDDLDTRSMAYMPKVKNLLTDQGTSFSNYFLSVSLCCPSRATTLRGQYGHNTHVLDNAPPEGGYQTFYERGEEKSTIATWLHDGGYKTILLGKYLNGYPKNVVAETYVPPGWDNWYSPGAGNAYGQFNYDLNENGKIVHYGSSPEDFENDVLSKKATDFIQQTKKPFFMYFATYSPHGPSTAAPRHDNLFQDLQLPRSPDFNEPDITDKPQWLQSHDLLSDNQISQLTNDYRKRIRSLQSVDDFVESIINELKQTGQLDTTYIVFSSDNGFHLGEHRLPLGKNTAYEEDIRVPFIIRGPGIPAGKTMGQLVGNVDLATTFADLAGVSTPSFVDGRSILPLLRSNPPDWRSAYLLEHSSKAGGKNKNKKKVQPTPEAKLQSSDLTIEPLDVLAAVTSKNSFVKPAKGQQAPPFTGIRTKEYLYVEYETGEKELYDLKKDPYQLQNIAVTADSSLLQKLSKQVADLKGCSGDSCRKADSQ